MLLFESSPAHQSKKTFLYGMSFCFANLKTHQHKQDIWYN